MANVNIPTKVTGDTFTAVELNTIVTYLNGFTVYRAVMTQSGSTAPDLTVLENTTGKTFTASRNSAGNYTLTINTATTIAKTFLIIGSAPINTNVTISAQQQTTTTIVITSIANSSGANVDNVLTQTAIEFRIYP